MRLPALAAAKSRAKQTSCRNSLKQTGLAYKLYRGDNNDINCPQRMCPDTANDDALSATARGPFDGLFIDAHVQAFKPVELQLANFRQPGSLPVETAYPGQ